MFVRKFETAVLSSRRSDRACGATDKINGGTVKNDDASPKRKDISRKGSFRLGQMLF